MRQYRWMTAALLAAGMMAAGALEAWAGQAGLQGPAVYRKEAMVDGGPGAAAKTVGSMGQDTRSEDMPDRHDGAVPGPGVVDGVIQPQNLKGAEEADQLVVVAGTGGCNADAYYYKKEEGVWSLVWKEASIVGRGGITSEKAEGDGKTPAGSYGFTMAFGLKEDPGSVLPYHKVGKGDYWVDDPGSAYYNQMVNTSVTPKAWNSAEDLALASPYYNYALALDYNQDRVPGKGSAIFLHCFTASADNGSAGCIRLPESRARELVQSLTPQSRIVIARDIEALE